MGKFQFHEFLFISLFFCSAISSSLVPDNPLVDNQVQITPAGSTNQSFGTVIRVNIGGQTVNESGGNWIPDDQFLNQSSYSSSNDPCSFYQGALTYNNSDKDSAPSLVYKTCRGVNSIANFSNITWNFNVSKNTKHRVRIHICDIVSEALNTLKFSLYVNNNFSQLVDAYNRTGALAAPFYEDFTVDSDDSGVIIIGVGPRNDSYLKSAYLNGLEIMELLDEKKSHNKQEYIIYGSVGIFIVLVFILSLSVIISRKRKKAKKQVENMDSEYMHLTVIENGSSTEMSRSVTVPNLNLKMSLNEILEATRNFNVKLVIGEGGFGKVYKGTLQTGQNVAVKRSDSKHGQGLPEFQTEITVLSRIRHRHLVSLIGYCDEGSEMVLVYEFMEKGTLRDHLYNNNSSPSSSPSSSSSLPKLTWKQRLRICIDAAKGLHYLHTGAEGGIVHRDVKSTNILLDSNYLAKVADFGLSRQTPVDSEDLSMVVKGSFGYLDPEYFRSLHFTDKSDVYSFGVVLLEILCARPAIISTSTIREEVNLGEWGMFWLKKGQLEKIMDPLLKDQVNPNSLRKFGEIVEKCLKSNGAERPPMSDVRWDLEYVLQLQQTAFLRQPHEDCTTTVDDYSSSNLGIMNGPTMNFDSKEFSALSIDMSVGAGSDSTTPAEVFSQLRIGDGR
ncbi:LOW QUALITY PROTEIN: receptor-like protein kinase THESEUS 1 [Rutidosis leptorrhynchoides]|uniref:LOW QUALITY PROTEIN: receptor-like protein kinase THESEUS 1 n=1 Tax=Rutidosis leptorrhynchoides TaxID=125765 RepID=UPI003A992354